MPVVMRNIIDLPPSLSRLRSPALARTHLLLAQRSGVNRHGDVHLILAVGAHQVFEPAFELLGVLRVLGAGVEGTVVRDVMRAKRRVTWFGVACLE